MKDHSDKIHEGHEDEETDYKFAAITSHRYNLTTQSEEVIRIKQAWTKVRLLTIIRPKTFGVSYN